MANIHPTAVVDPGAKLADDVTVGPLATIGSEVELGAGVEIGPQVCIAGRTRIGARTRIHPFAAIGLTPQVLGFDGRAGELVIGEDNEVRRIASELKLEHGRIGVCQTLAVKADGGRSGIALDEDFRRTDARPALMD